jgi:shikimate kinase
MGEISQKAQTVRRALGKRSLVLVGMMGCGKTAVGRRLAHALDLPFVDADDEIELAAGKSISEIFSDHGEAHFRDGERKVIARLLKSAPQVLATGGGAFMDADTRARIRDSSVSVWLKADLPILLRRVMRRDNRPLLKTNDPEGRLRELIALRYPIYGEADITIESREISHDHVVGEILDALLEGPLAARASA